MRFLLCALAALRIAEAIREVATPAPPSGNQQVSGDNPKKTH